jgi:hypothetical protein
MPMQLLCKVNYMNVYKPLLFQLAAAAAAAATRNLGSLVSSCICLNTQSINIRIV